jgi:phosphoglycolate phosphatase-like HAD superfamily hydrolase
MLFLFDIDGTLLRGMPPVHRAAICVGLHAVYGVDIVNEQLGKTAGMTDTAIAARALREAGAPEATIAEGLPRFYAVVADYYDEHVPEDLSACTTPHCREALDWLVELGASLALVTGNIERVAWRKLRAAKIDAYFSCGGFGDEAESRNNLPPLAFARAERVFGRTFARMRTFVVGDTPHDVACGAAASLRTVAVATGPYHSVADLLACGADYAFEDLHGLLTLELR